jgi:GT2 family glycosyltransferase
VEGLAVVIAAYRSERTVGRCLARFTAEVPDAEIIVVDSAPDGASAAVAAGFPGVRAVHSRERLWPHAARNRGARETEAPLLLFTDPDIYPRPGAVAAMRSAQHETGGAVVAALACHGTRYLDRAAHVAKFDLWLPRPGLTPVELGPTAGLLVARADWKRVGMIPEDGMLGDTLFSWALTDAGVPLHLAGEAVFEHDHGSSFGALVRERFDRGSRFAELRRLRCPGRAARTRDVATTVTLLRPARVTLRSASAAWRYSGRAEAAETLPVVAAAQLAWFAGELAGMAQHRGR